MFNFDLLKSKSVWGIVTLLVGFLAQPAVLAILPERASAILAAVGGLVAAIGYRDAIAKSGPTP